MQLAVAAFVCPLEHAMRHGAGTAAEGLDCGVPVPFSQFHKGLPMCGGKGGSGTLHKISAAAGPSSDGGLLAVWAFLGSVLLP